MARKEEHTYLLKLPLSIYKAAQAKAAAHNPPLSMRWVMISLLEKWVNHGAAKMPDPVATDETPIAGQPGKAAKAPKAPRAAKTPKAKAQKIPAASVKIDLPDLGSAF